jgi:hypothetical protein
MADGQRRQTEHKHEKQGRTENTHDEGKQKQKTCTIANAHDNVRDGPHMGPSLPMTTRRWATGPSDAERRRRPRHSEQGDLTVPQNKRKIKEDVAKKQGRRGRMVGESTKSIK